MGIERRIHPRAETRMSAELACGSDAVTGVIENIGAGGIFFATEDLEILVDDGADVVVRFEARHDDAPKNMECAGRILRSERYFDGARVVRAFAIKFAERLDVSAFTFSA